MRQRTSIFDALGNSARPRVLAPRGLTLFTVVVAVVFVLMVPNPTLERRAIESRRGDLLTVAYLANLLRTDPDDPALRFALARQQLARNETDAARATLRPLLDSPDPQLRADSHWRDWLSYREAWSRLPDGSPLRPALHKAMLRRLHELAAETWPEDMQVRIAADAFTLGERALGSQTIKALARRPGTRFDAGWYAESARTLLEAGDYRGGAELYLVARKRATSLQARRSHYLAALHTLQAGNLLDEAVTTAERELDDLADDTETLYAVVVLARACGRPDVADRLARRMIRLSLRDQLQRWQLAQAGLDASLRPTAGTASATAPAGAPGLAFDERIYSLAYDAFLGNRNLADAYRVAESAVRQRPDDLAWRERLAKVAEWHGQPRVALDQWLVLARRDGRRDAWEAVLRLAPGLTDDEALVAALEWDARRQTPDPTRLAAVVATYERLGRVQEALAFLQARAGDKAPAEVLEALEQLAERAGEIDLAIATLGRLEARLGPDPRRAERVVALLMREGRGREAFAALERAKPHTAPGDKAFWRLHADLAAFIEDKPAAQDSYRRVADFDDVTETEFTRYLELVREADPAAAGPVAERAWQRFGQTAQLKRVLDLYAEAGREADIARVLGQLTPAQRRDAEQDARFLAQRGRHHQLAGRRAAARADYQQALALQPRAEGVREALLWMLIDGNDAPTLRNLLARHEDAWAEDEALHDALAAAWQALSRPQRALDRYYTPRLREHRGDFLWMLGYADALEQNGDTDRAWRLREALLQQARRERPADAEPTAAQLDQARRAARLRLARSQNPGDPSHAVLREILRLDRPADAPFSPAARELVLAWFIDQGQIEGVRGFLWHQYGKSLARPLWAETTAALGSADPREAGRLLEQWDERLPRYDRVNLARLAGTPAIAATAAFEAMDLQRDDETSHLQLTEIMLEQADRADLDFAQRQLGSIDESFTGARLDIGLAPRLRLAVELGRVSRQIIDRNYFSALPGLEALAMARLDWQHDDGTTRLAIGRRDSYASYTPVLVEREQRINRQLSVTATVGRDQPATENAALRVAGLRQQAGLGLTLRLSGRDQLNLRFDDYRYSAQNGLPIGRARQTQLEYAHAFRSELSDLIGSAFASSYAFEGGVDTTDPRAVEIKQRLFVTTPVDAAALAPSSFKLYGLRLSTNTRHITDYTRALRPFGSVGLLHNSVVGAGYDYSLGLAGSVLGNDHFSALLREDKGGTGTYAKTRQFALHYRYLF